MPAPPLTVRSLKLTFQGRGLPPVRAEHVARAALERVSLALSPAGRERARTHGNLHVPPVTVRLTSHEQGAAIVSLAAAILESLERG